MRAGRGKAAIVGLMSVAICGLAGSAGAGPGDIHQIEADRVNLRSGPSEKANIRTTLMRGDRVVEIRRDGQWVGVRDIDTGAEGWIYEDLLQVASPSSFGDPNVALGGTEAGFQTYSKGFDSLMASIGQRLGYQIFDEVERIDNNRLRLIPSADFMRGGSQDAHLMAALAVHQMWKNHQDGRPVSVTLMGASGEEYVTIDDMSEAGPALEVLQLREASR